MDLPEAFRRTPVIDPTAYIAEGVEIHGDVTIGPEVSIWFNTVIRTEYEPITIGEGTNIQDVSLLHTDPGCPVVIGKDVTIGHRVVVHGCEIGDGALIGIGSIVLSRATIGAGAIVAAGALVPEGFHVPDDSVAMGVPAKIARTVRDIERIRATEGARRYRQMAGWYRAQQQ